jgi:hypothetical protein
MFEVVSPVVRPLVRQLGTAGDLCPFSWPYYLGTPSQNSPLQLLVSEELTARDSSCHHRRNGAWVHFDDSDFLVFHLVYRLLHTNSHDFECRDVVGRFCAWSICEILPGQRQDYDASALTRRRKR